MKQRDARFIVLEGLDGAGTTTQAAKLQAHWTRRGTPSFLTHEPTPDPVGAFIRRLLSGHERAADGSPYRPSENVMGLLFAADRRAHARVIAARLQAGQHVICDRYVFSSMAYQTLDPDVSAEWVVEINQGCAVPDVTVFLSVPVDVCLQRLKARSAHTTIYETRALLEPVAKNYQRLMLHYQTHFGRVVEIDGTRAIEDVHADIVQAVEAG